MNPFDAIEKLITEHGSAAILRERITQLREQFTLATERAETAEARTKNLEAQLRDARMEVERLKPPGLEESMGVLWKRTPAGFEQHPYCKECPSHPVMTPMHRARIWVCGTGDHHAPLSVRPPSA